MLFLEDQQNGNWKNFDNKLIPPHGSNAQHSAESNQRHETLIKYDKAHDMHDENFQQYGSILFFSCQKER